VLAAALEPLVRDPARRAEMGAAMKALARPDAAAAVIEWATGAARRLSDGL
jgi:UDP-N-acetylglucosamine:LPS N-acetylglucosamine transferase